MKIFDSIKNRKWSGRGVEIKASSLLALKSANFSHRINIRAGKYTLKVTAKKRTGSGKITVEILTDHNNILLKKDLSFTKNTWSELTFSFEVSKNMGPGKIRFLRNGKVYGSIEIGRVYIDVVSDTQKKAASIASIKALSSREDRITQSLKASNISGRSTYIESPTALDKKIAFLIPYRIYGGAEVYLKSIINNLTGFSVTIIYMKANNLQENISAKNVQHTTVRDIEHLEGVLKSSEYDFIVYYNRADIYNSLVELKSSRKIRGKLVEIYHSDFIWSGSISKLKKRAGIDKMISVSKSLAKDIKGISDDKRTVIPVGIDIERFSPKSREGLKLSLGIDKEKVVVGVVARLSREKRINYIISLAEKASDIEFVIVGDGPERHRIESRVAGLELKNVHIVGRKKDVERYYNIFDSFVLASDMEGTPISIIEAMASGVPVFTNMVGAIPDLIEDKVTGFKINGDPTGDLEIIRAGIGDKSVIDSARAYAVKNHNINNTHIKFADVLHAIDNYFVRKVETTIVLKGEYI